MATLQQATAYNTARGNTAWATLDSTRATALLEDAEAYILGTYAIRTNLTVEEKARFDNIVCRLAATFQASPPQTADAATVKRTVLEGEGVGKKETEYFQAGSDPYPYVTAVLRAFIVQPSSGGVSIAKLVR